MKVYYRHSWNVNTHEAKKIQEKLAGEIIREGKPADVRLVAGIDVAVSRYGHRGAAVVAVLDYTTLMPVEIIGARGEIQFPYVPGLLTFREAPLILAACEALNAAPDLVFVDGQGIAHPRRLGLAAHIGLCLEVPTVGVAKSRLWGEHDEPGDEKGDAADLRDGEEVIGRVVRTREKVKPLYISIGHRINLESAVSRVLECCRGYRLPEPTRHAHMAAGEFLKNIDKCGKIEIFRIKEV